MHTYDILWPLVCTDSCNAAGRVVGSTSKQWLKPEVYPIHVCIATGPLLLKPAQPPVSFVILARRSLGIWFHGLLFSCEPVLR